MISVLQINVGGGSAAQGLALQTAAELGSDYILLREYYKFGKVHEAWLCDSAQKAAIAPMINIPMDQTCGGTNDGFCILYSTVTVGDIRIYSGYWSPNTTHADYENFLRRLEASIRTSPISVVVGGDFNVKHWCWSSRIDDARGDALADMAQALNLVICNHGHTPPPSGKRRQQIVYRRDTGVGKATTACHIMGCSTR